MGAQSFTEYVANTFENEFYAACKEWIEENKDSLDISENDLHRIGELDVDKVNVKYVWVEDQPDMRIKFDVSVEVDYFIGDGDYHHDNCFSGQTKLMLSCQGDLAKKLEDLEITDISDCDCRGRSKDPLSDSLVPIIYKNDLDHEAEEILRRYYPKALLQPMIVDPYELANKMGLTVRMDYLTNDATIFGCTFFYDCEAELYDPDTNEMYKKFVKVGTIIVDKQAYFLYVVGASNNTIVHECIHWEKHKKAVALARLYNESLSSIGCKVVGGIAENSKDSFDWMEWHANSIAPKVQMPKEMFTKYVDGLVTKYRRETKEYEIIDIIEPMITEVAVTFGVSKTAAKFVCWKLVVVRHKGRLFM